METLKRSNRTSSSPPTGWRTSHHTHKYQLFVIIHPLLV